VTPLLDIRMNNGARHFAGLPETYDVQEPEWHRLRAHVAAMPGAQITAFVTDDVTEAWLDWRYRDHRFSANNQFNEWWLFVEDPACPDEILLEVIAWLETLLGPRVS
jgi:hypothetical protein